MYTEIQDDTIKHSSLACNVGMYFILKKCFHLLKFRVIAVGIGNIPMNDLQQLASSLDFAFQTIDMDGLPGLFYDVLDVICPPQIECCKLEVYFIHVITLSTANGMMWVGSLLT